MPGTGFGFLFEPQDRIVFNGLRSRALHVDLVQKGFHIWLKKGGISYMVKKRRDFIYGLKKEGFHIWLKKGGMWIMQIYTCGS